MTRLRAVGPTCRTLVDNIICGYVRTPEAPNIGAHIMMVGTDVARGRVEIEVQGWAEDGAMLQPVFQSTLSRGEQRHADL